MYTLEKVWPEWKIEREIGRGSYGIVYKCVKEDKRHKEYAAVKVISVPRDEYEMEDVVAEKMTQEQSKAYYKDIADDLLKEIEILKSLKGTKNIVEIYDAKVIEKDDGIGWNIFISMEMLTDFTTYASDKKFSQEDVIKLGTDLSSALSVCHKSRIIHRDIKPENIFVDEYGNYKLGDFGVAKQMEKTKGSVSVKGTYGYMSPEVFSGKKCDGRADLYSLALVMYKLLNNNRFPFIDANKQIVKYSERQQAFERRIKGESIPPIEGISSELNEVLLKACSFKSVDRQKNIDEFRKQLELAGKGKKSGKKVKMAIAVAASVVVLASAITAIVYFANQDKTKPVEEAPSDISQEVERERNNVSSIGMGLDFIREDVAANAQCLVEGKGENSGKVYFSEDIKSERLKNLSDTLTNAIKQNGNNESEINILACDGEMVYYTKSDKSKLYKYDMKSAEKNISDENLAISYPGFYIESVVYFDEDYTYLGIRNKDDDKTYLAIFDNYSYKKTIPANNLFEDNGYIIFDAETKIETETATEIQTQIKYFDAPAYEENKEATAVCKGDLNGGIYTDGEGDMYFVAEDQETGLVIKRYHLKSGEESITPDVVGRFKDVKADGVADNWKITEWFNDKVAVVCNESQTAKDKWYIWDYENETLNAINYKIYAGDQELAELEFFVDEVSEEHDVMLAIWEGYSCRVYKIATNGAITPVGKNLYVNKRGDDCYRIGSKFYNIGDDNKLVCNEYTADFTKKEETVYANNYNLLVFLAPTTDSASMSNRLTKYQEVHKLGEINGEWSMIVVNDMIGYIKNNQLEAPKCTEDDINALVEEVNAKGLKYNVVSTEKFVDGLNCILYIKGTTQGIYSYDIDIQVYATLTIDNNKREWIIKNVKLDEPENIVELRKYIDPEEPTGKALREFYTHFSLYDVNGDGTTELVCTQKVEKGKTTHGIFIYNDKGYVQRLGGNEPGQEHQFKTKDFELYEIKNHNGLYYFKNGVNANNTDGVELMLVGMDELKVKGKEITYSGSTDDLVPIESYSLNDYNSVLPVITVIQKEE